MGKTGLRRILPINPRFRGFWRGGGFRLVMGRGIVSPRLGDKRSEMVNRLTRESRTIEAKADAEERAGDFERARQRSWSWARWYLERQGFRIMSGPFPAPADASALAFVVRRTRGTKNQTVRVKLPPHCQPVCDALAWHADRATVPELATDDAAPLL